MDESVLEVELEVLKKLLRCIGVVVGRLYGCGIVYGDLMMSNMMVWDGKVFFMVEVKDVLKFEDDKLEGEIVFLDFGFV